jgi:dTDP-4-dehydrorhamnose reductase
MKILLIGANGQLGSDLMLALSGHDVLGTARGSISPDDGTHTSTAIALDVCDATETRAVIASFKPDVVINTAAFHRVDDIEKDASRALQVNALAAQQLALICKEAGAALMHISTDYVFDGAKRTPYVESDLPNPLSAYGASKLAGELLIRAAWPRHYIIRTCGLYGLAGTSGKAEGPRSAAKGSGNFVNAMLRLAHDQKAIKVVDDQICTPTFTQDLAAQLVALIETGAYGTYHITNDGATSWHGFAAEIFRLSAVQADLQPTTSAEFNAPARRPLYSVLENRSLKNLGIDRMRPWPEALADYIRQKQGG